jgi:hypothetical protein
MTTAVTLWLTSVAAMAIVAWFGNTRQAVALTCVAILTAPAALVPLGHATPLAPPAGEHAVLGARVDVDKAIYVLLDQPDAPVYYVLPYSEEAAKALQDAQSAAEGEGQVAMRMGQDGKPGFYEKSPPPEPAKSAERAVIGG